MTPPMTTPEATTPNAPHQLVDMPTSTRDSRSRPTVSVPSQFSALGPVIGFPAGTSGSKGARTCAKIATRNIAASAPKAIQLETDVPRKVLVEREGDVAP